MTKPVTTVRPRHLFLWLATYFLLQICVRLSVTATAEYDEAEQVELTQQLLRGYGVQPPLYTWLQASVFAVCGLNLFSLALLKNILLGGTFFFTYRTVKAMTGTVTTAAAATVSIFFLPQIAWESQRDQSHSVLAVMLGAATLLAFVRLARSRSLADYVVFGFVAGLGCMSKYNYAVFLAGLLLASGWLKEFRPIVTNRRMLGAVAMLVVMLLPHGTWMWAHQSAVLSRVHETVIEKPSWWLGSLAGLGSLVSAVVGFSAMAAVIYGAIFWRAQTVTMESSAARTHRRLVGATMLAGLLICAALAVFGQARFKDRWMQPLLFMVPLWLALRVQARLDVGRWRWLRRLAVVVAVGILVAIAATPHWALANRRLRYLNPDYSAFAAQIKAQGFTRGVMARDGHKLGGNLKLFFPDTPSLGADHPGFSAPTNVPLLVVWNAAGNAAGHDGLTNVVWQQRGVVLDELTPTFVTVPYETLAEPAAKFGFVIIPPAKQP
ncbi:MAG: hypothetical protein RL380_1287 [Verrucomicrobiota bacterium]|jgi:4-amino-4-deoxy-L-arabinose transferase-like glycosyltransferase